jgi:hypothetical protein
MRESISLSRPKEERSEFENILDSIVLGVINSLIFLCIFITLWKFGLMKIPNNISYDKSFLYNASIFIKNNPWILIILLFLYIFIPFLMGYFIGKWDYNIGKYKLVRINSFPSAWDEFFTNTTNCTLYIFLRNGTKVCGTFGQLSRASTNPKQRDIYLEKEILLDNDGNIKEINESSNGLWINRDDIIYFKVLPYYVKEKE